MKKRVLKTFFCLSLSAAMLLGEAGAVLADTTNAKVEITEEATENKREEKDVTWEEAGAVELTEDELGAKVVPAVYTVGDVSGLAYDATTGVLSWGKVSNATQYRVEMCKADGTSVRSRTTGYLYMDIRNNFESYADQDVAYTFKVTAENTSEICLVATDVAGVESSKWNEAAQKYVEGIYSADGNTLLYEEGVAYDTYTCKTFQNADGTTSYLFTLYKYPIDSVNPAVASVIVRPSAKAAVSALAGISVKEVSDSYVTFAVNPGVVQLGEYVEYEYSNNAAFIQNSDEDLFTNSDELNTTDGVITEDIDVYLGNFTAGDTVYVKAWVYNPNYDYTAVAGQTEENRKSAEVTTSYTIPAAVMNDVAVIVTKDSVRLEPSSTGVVTGYQYQRKNGKKWITLAQQGDNYTDKGLKADTKYTYRVRGYIYNKKTGKNAYTDWKTVSATTWGSSLNLKASAASATSVKLTWSKVSGVDGYEIYRVDTDSTYYNYKNGENTERFDNKTLVKTIKKAKTTKYTDKKLTKGNTYEYMVRAYRTVGKTKNYIDETVTVTLSAKGMKQTAAYYNAKGQYVVKWNKMTGISGYKVEKYNEITNKYDVYKTLKKSATSVTLPSVAVGSEAVEYRIRPYSGSKYYGGLGNYEVYPKLAAVKNVKAVQTAEGVQVSWSPVAGADYYKVYRAKKDSAIYDKTTKTYNLGSYYESVYEVNYEDTSAGISLAVKDTADVKGYKKVYIADDAWTYDEYDNRIFVDAQGVKHYVDYTYEYDADDNYVRKYYYEVESGAVYKQYNYDTSLNNAIINDGAFYNDLTAYSTSEIKGTSVVDKTVTVTGLVEKNEDPAYNKDADPEYYKDGSYYLGRFGRYQKNADGSLKTKQVTMNNGPEVGTEYYYFVMAVAEPVNGANTNSTDATSIGYSKSAKVVYTNVAAGKTSKVTSAKSSKKETATLKFKKVSGVKGYAVYRSTKKNGTYTQIGTSTKPNYTDNNVTGGKTYYYKVATYKQSENGTFIYSKLSSAKKVKIKK